MITGVLLSFELFAITLSMEWGTNGGFARVSSPILALVSSVGVTGTLGVGIGYAFRNADAAKFAYVTRRQYERWWWFECVVLLGFLAITAVTLGIGGYFWAQSI